MGETIPPTAANATTGASAGATAGPVIRARASGRRPRRGRGRRSLAVLLAAAAASPLFTLPLGGCAVTTIDVDIYKGPLANEDGVQSEQVAALAIAARPLLAQLRSSLLAGEPASPNGYRRVPATQPTADQKRSAAVLGRVCDSTTFIHPADKDNYSVFAGSGSDKIHARRVNALLSFYEDKSADIPGPFGEIARGGQRLIVSYAKNKRVLGELGPADVESAKSITDALARLPAAAATSGSPQKAVLDAYYVFFSELEQPGYRSLKKLMDLDDPDRPASAVGEPAGRRSRVPSLAWRTFAQVEASVPPVPKEKPTVRENPDDPDAGDRGRELTWAADLPDLVRWGVGLDRPAGAAEKTRARRLNRSQMYERLADPAFVDRQLAVAFPEPADLRARERVKAQVLCVARAFGSAKADVEKGMLMSLDLIEAAGSADGQALENQTLITQLAAELASKLMDPKDVLSAERFDPALIKSIEGHLSAECGCDPRAVTDRAQVARAIARELREDPACAPAKFRRLHAAYRQGPGNPAGNPYGISRGPTINLDPTRAAVADVDPELLIGLVNRLYGLMSGEGYEYGRPDAGLRTLIQNYVDARQGAIDRPPPLPVGPEAGADLAERRLHEGLVHFAEKLLFVANYDALLADPQRGPAADEWEGGQSRRTAAIVKRYAQVLQSIGNEILVQVNERRHKRDYEQSLPQRGQAEVRALQRTLPLDAPAALGVIVSQLTARQAAAREASGAATAEAARQRKDQEAAAKAAADLRAKALPDVKDGKYDGPAADLEKQSKDKAKEATDLEKRVKELKELIPSDEQAAAAATDAAAAASRELAAARAADPYVRKAIDDLRELTTNPLATPERIAEARRIVGRVEADSDAVQRALKADADKQGKEKAARDKLQADQAELKDQEPKATAARADAKKLDDRVQVLADAKVKDQQEKTAKEAADAAEKRAEKEKGTADAALATVGVVSYYRKAWPAEEPDAAKFDPRAVLHVLRERIAADINAAPPATQPAAPAAPAAPAVPAAPAAPDATKVADARPTVADLKLALETLKSQDFTQVLPVDVSGLRSDPRKVVDQLVATYEYEYVEAVKAGGADGSTARNLRAAIDAAKNYRARLIHIRPPAAFLRSSYPISSLQSGTATAWQNMLGRHYARQIPFFGESLDQSLSDGDASDRRIVRDLDRQNWQNINRVRVAGGGIANYVMVKDDIGNWSVKSYVSNPEPIIKAAKAAALYGASQGAGVDLLAQDRLRAANPANPPEPAAAAKAFEREAGAFRGAYAQATAKHAKQLADTAEGLRGDLQNAWAADPEVDKVLPRAKATAILSATDKGRADAQAAGEAAAAAAADKAAAAKDPAAAGPAKTVAGGLANLVTYETALLGEVAALPAPAKKPLDDAKAALADQEAKQAKAARRADFAAEAVRVQRDRLATVPADQLPAAQSALQSAVAEQQAADAASATEAVATKAAKAAADDAQASYDKAVAALRTAKKVVVDKVGGAADKLAAARLTAAGEYETAVRVLLESQAKRSKP